MGVVFRMRRQSSRQGSPEPSGSAFVKGGGRLGMYPQSREHRCETSDVNIEAYVMLAV